MGNAFMFLGKMPQKLKWRAKSTFGHGNCL